MAAVCPSPPRSPAAAPCQAFGLLPALCPQTGSRPTPGLCPQPSCPGRRAVRLSRDPVAMWTRGWGERTTRREHREGRRAFCGARGADAAVWDSQSPRPLPGPPGAQEGGVRAQPRLRRAGRPHRLPGGLRAFLRNRLEPAARPAACPRVPATSPHPHPCPTRVGSPPAQLLQNKSRRGTGGLRLFVRLGVVPGDGAARVVRPQSECFPKRWGFLFVPASLQKH